MRLVMGVVLPLLLQVPVCIWLIFGNVIKVPGGSFVPLGAMLIAPILVLASLIINASRLPGARQRGDSLVGLFFRACAVALSVPVLLALLIMVGAAVLD